ncbi:MAG: WD40 repeat domain-containing protein, partial [Armatimonadota bacterium]|nr:WD40 repeat domain-containing protein [Armatimonadota bacterium]
MPRTAVPRACCALVLALFALCLPLASAWGQAAVLTQHNDNARTGANLQETLLTPYNVNVTNFGKLFTRSLDANVNGQVLYAPHITINGTVRNVIFAYTSNNSNGSPSSVYAFDADDPNQSTPLWRHQFSAGSAQWTTCAPVIDLSTNTIFVLTKDTNDSGANKLRALDITTGAEKPGSPIAIAASVPGNGDGSSNGVVTFDNSHANCRPGLLLLGHTVYVGFAHNSDSFPYHGWIFAYTYDGTRFTQSAVFCNAPDGGEDGIWQGGKGLAADAQGNIYCTVGNGSFNVANGGYGMCILKLNPTNLTVSDYFSPHDESPLSNSDLDMGNCGPLLIPGVNRLFAGGTKFGSGFLLNSTDLGGFTVGGPDRIIERLDGLTPNDKVGQNPVVWDTGTVKYVYNWASTINLQQLRYDPAVDQFSPAGNYKQTSNLTNGGSLSITANGNLNAILWAMGNNGVFHAFDATNVSKPELWNSSMNSTRDNLGSVGKWEFPTVVNGKAYVPTGNGKIVVYGLLPTATAPQTHVLWNNDNKSIAIWNQDVTTGGFTPHFYGPYAGWTAKAIADGPDGKTRVLWTRPDGAMILWKLDNGTGVYSLFQYGPYDGWTAVGLAVGPDNKTRIVWNNADGTVALWDVDDASGAFRVNFYGPYGAWTAAGVSVGADNNARILWNNADHSIAVWSVDNTSGAFTPHFYGPYGNWSCAAISTGRDNITHLLWNNTDTSAILWNLNTDTGAFT